MGLFALLTNFDGWILTSKDNPTEAVLGQFPTEVSESVSSNFSQFKSLNRETPIVQFLNGNADTLSLPVRFFSRDATAFRKVKNNVKQLKKWARRDPKLQRPHILSFRIGDGFVKMDSCVITGLSPIEYEKPTILGKIKDVSFTLDLLAYKEFTLEDEGIFETRYHRAKERDYYEMLCYEEYGNAELGDVIRKRHPDQSVIETGDVIKLPSIEAIQKDIVEPKSLVLKGSYKRKSSDQKDARNRAFDRTNKTYTSHVVV